MSTKKLFSADFSEEIYNNLVNNVDMQLHTSQSGEDVVLQRIFHGKKNGFYVDIGSFHPVKYSNTYMLHRLFGWKGINIDASSESIELFKQSRPDDINIHSAVGSREGQMNLIKFKHPARNTLSKKNLKRQLNRGDTEVVGHERVEVKRLSKILNEYVPENTKIDLLDVDVEGYDLDVLKTNDWNRFRPKVILIEDYEYSSGQTTKVSKYLTSLSYSLNSHVFDTSIYIYDSATTSDGTFDNYKQLKKLIGRLKRKLENI